MAKYKTKIIEFRLGSLSALNEFYSHIGGFFTNASYNADEFITIRGGGRIYRTSTLKFFAVVDSREAYEAVEELTSDAHYTRSILG